MKPARKLFVLLLVLALVSTTSMLPAQAAGNLVYQRVWTNGDMNVTSVTSAYSKSVTLKYSGVTFVSGTCGYTGFSDYCNLSPVQDVIRATVGNQSAGGSGLYYGNYAGPGYGSKTSNSSKYHNATQLYYGVCFYGTCNGYSYTPSGSTVTFHWS